MLRSCPHEGHTSYVCFFHLVFMKASNTLKNEHDLSRLAGSAPPAVHLYESKDCFKGKPTGTFTGTHRFSHKVWVFLSKVSLKPQF